MFPPAVELLNAERPWVRVMVRIRVRSSTRIRVRVRVRVDVTGLLVIWELGYRT